MLQGTLFEGGKISSNFDPHLASMAAHDSRARGAVFTKREVVDFMLDTIGYDAESDLTEYRLLEPSFGQGDFLIPAVERLVSSYGYSNRDLSVYETLKNALRGVELHHDSFNKTVGLIRTILLGADIPEAQAERLLSTWLTRGDFLLTKFDNTFSHVVGNPPYIRQELIPAPLLAEYKRRYQTIYDRADIYIPFIERALRLLKDEGKLCYICSDRWMKNRYGRPLREIIANGFSLDCYVDMQDTLPFHSKVTAYPAITVISKGSTSAGRVRIAARPKLEVAALKKLSSSLREVELAKDCEEVKELTEVLDGGKPWVLDASNDLRLIRMIEAKFPLLEEVGCKVGIGVATGADKVFIQPFESLAVEPERKLKLILPRDIKTGVLEWQGMGMVNPYDETRGELIRLDDYPRTKAFFQQHKDVLLRRHCAKKNPRRWFKTIDRIHPWLTKIPKLLIPDIKGRPQVVFAEGGYYPQHNLYYVLSSEWDLLALRAVLMSCLTRLFISAYSPRMRGGYWRFQAQYIRRLRLPKWESISQELRESLSEAGKSGDLSAANLQVEEVFSLSKKFRKVLRDYCDKE